jgi:hypothetical protein
MPAAGDGGYQVQCSKAVGDPLRELQRQATRQGQGQAFVAAFRRIVGALRQNPTWAGEPLYRLPKLRLQVRTFVIIPLAIDFAVSEDHPQVYIKSGKLLSSSNS